MEFLLTKPPALNPRQEKIKIQKGIINTGNRQSQKRNRRDKKVKSRCPLSHLQTPRRGFPKLNVMNLVHFCCFLSFISSLEKRTATSSTPQNKHWPRLRVWEETIFPPLLINCCMEWREGERTSFPRRERKMTAWTSYFGRDIFFFLAMEKTKKGKQEEEGDDV